MALTTEEVRKIAVLARLRFSAEEEVAMASQLGEIVDYIDQLQAIETGAEMASRQPKADTEESRRSSDLPLPCMPRDTFLANAPASRDGFLEVPVIKGGARDADPA
jgi:aspartyl-tRNA(Asn)/glutamyl-tRNA(Gln) amidotransferase subunit C